jgi:hypothetical protein
MSKIQNSMYLLIWIALYFFIFYVLSNSFVAVFHIKSNLYHPEKNIMEPMIMENY